MRVKAKTRSGEREVRVRLAENPEVELVTFEQADRSVSREAEAFRKAWLGSKAKHTLPDVSN